MIVPLVMEPDWRTCVDALPPLALPSAPVLVLSPHPDDETLASGGLIHALCAAGAQVRVIAVTDGENAYEDTMGLGPVREREQTAALRQLGVAAENILRLRLPDSSVAAHQAQLEEQLLFELTPGSTLIAPWRGDFHPDHEACGRAAEVAAQQTGATLISCFFWTYHRGTPALIRNLGLRSFVLDPEAVRCKGEALQEHQSQLRHPSGEPILPQNLLWPAHLPYEVFLAR